MTRVPRILIASSSEGLSIAEKVQQLSSPQVESLLWSQDFFVPGQYPVESLEIQQGEFDGALVIATADDRVISRGRDVSAPRDNLLFEFGIFISVFGRRRALLMVENVGNTKLPSDLGGLTVIGFDKTDPLPVGLGPAVTKLKDSASWLSKRPIVDSAVVNQLERTLQIGLSDLQEAAGLIGDLGLHIFLLDRRSTPPELRRITRVRSSPKLPKPWPPFSEGVGIVGTSWKVQDSVFVDFAESRFHLSESEWESLDPPARYGMSYQLMVESCARYRCAGAVPITELSRGFLGCVSYNLGVASPATADVMQQREVVRAIDRCTQMVSIVLADISL